MTKEERMEIARKEYKHLDKGNYLVRSNRENVLTVGWGGKYISVSLESATLEQWLNSRGGRTPQDIKIDENGKYVFMQYKGEECKVRLPVQYQRC